MSGTNTNHKLDKLKMLLPRNSTCWQLVQYSYSIRRSPYDL